MQTQIKYGGEKMEAPCISYVGNMWLYFRGFISLLLRVFHKLSDSKRVICNIKNIKIIHMNY